MLIVKQEKPPFFKAIVKYLPDFHEHGTCVYGGILYNWAGIELTSEHIAHEEEHAKQMTSYHTGEGYINLPPKLRVEEWWKRYLRSDSFRLSQELPAMQRELWVYKMVEKDREKILQKKIDIARRLKHPMYGSRISAQQVLKLLDSERLVNFRV